jgi:hypothetical protein
MDTLYKKPPGYKEEIETKIVMVEILAQEAGKGSQQISGFLAAQSINVVILYWKITRTVKAAIE